jgi:acetyltransferase
MTAATRSVEALLKPRSIAVIGASQNPTKRGNQVIQSLLAIGFQGRIYPINPTAKEILGLRAYSSVMQVAEEVDVAFIATPKSTVPQVLKECEDKRVHGAVIIGGGFAESGVPGAELQEALVASARRHGLRLIGPNTNGIYRAWPPLNLIGQFSIPPGDVAVLSQSGNVFLSLVVEAQERLSIGFSTYVGLGNQSDLDFTDFLHFLAEDAATTCVICYAEGVRDARRFLRAIRNASARKPVVILKTGRSEAGRRAVMSHSAAVSGSPDVWDGVLNQAGAIVVNRLDEVLPIAHAVTHSPEIVAGRVAIVADGGGHAALAADAVTAYGLALPQLLPDTQAKLRCALPEGAAIANPIDVAGGTDSSPALLADVVAFAAEDANIDAILVVGILGGYAMRFSQQLLQEELDTAVRIAEFQRRSNVPVIVHSAYEPTRSKVVELMRENGISVHHSIDVSARCIAALRSRGRFLRTCERRSDFRAMTPHRSGVVGIPLSEPQSRDLLRERGVAVQRWRHVRTRDEAASAAEELQAPIALKIVSPDVIHKSDVGGVELNVIGADAASSAFDAIVSRVERRRPYARLDGALITTMAPPGIELFVGLSTREDLGPIVSFGLGGRAVELIRALEFRAAPLTSLEACELVTTLAHRTNGSSRELATIDAARVQHLLQAVSDCANDASILEIDLNPVIVSPEGLVLVDVRVVVRGHKRTPLHSRTALG